MAQATNIRELVDRLESLSSQQNLSADQTKELQTLARQAADIVCTVESVKEERSER